MTLLVFQDSYIIYDYRTLSKTTNMAAMRLSHATRSCVFRIFKGFSYSRAVHQRVIHFPGRRAYWSSNKGAFTAIREATSWRAIRTLGVTTGLALASVGTATGVAYCADNRLNCKWGLQRNEALENSPWAGD